MHLSRPDVSCAISFAARVTEKVYTPKAILARKSVFKYLRRTNNACLQFCKVDMNSLRLLAYFDAGHCNREDGWSQAGYVVLLADHTSKFCILCYSLKKSRCVVRSITAGEVLAFAERIDLGHALRYELEADLGQTIPVV